MKTATWMVLCSAIALGQGPPDSRPSDDQRAIDLFKKAAAAQTPGGRPVAVRDFQAELEVTIHEKDEKTGEMVRRSGNVIQYYRDRGAKRPLFCRYLTLIGGSRTVQGFDGESFWQKLGDSAARDLRGRESRDERDRVVSEMNRTKEFLWFLFLTNLEGPGVTLRYAGRSTIRANQIDRPVEVVVREKPGEAAIELFIGESDGRTVLFGLSRKKESGKTELVAFAMHEVVRSGGAAALVPLVAQYREDGVLTFEARAQSATHLKLNTDIEDRIFAIPR